MKHLGFLLTIFYVLSGSGWTAEVSMSLRPTWNGAPLHFEGFRYQTPAKEIFSVTRWSMLLSGFSLQRDTGEWIDQEGAVAWIDLSTRRNSWSLGTVPPGTYQTLRFDIGLPPDINHGNPANYPADHPLNPLTNRLHWDWQTGYIFLALEGLIQTNDLTGYVYHLANDANRTRVEIPVKLHTRGDAHLNLDADLQRLFTGIQPIRFADQGFSTHSHPNDPLAADIKANLATVFSLRGIHSAFTTANAAPKKTPLYLPDNPTPFPFTIPATFPIPALPLDNPLLIQRVSLGKKLFADTRLSRDETVSCQSCHHTEKAFTDGLANSIGVAKRQTPRNSMPLFNLAWKDRFFWDGRVGSLRQQVLHPLQDHREMNADLDEVLARLKSDPALVSDFSAAFGDEGITVETLALALENFQLSLRATDSRFDRAMRGKETLNPEEQRGMELFFTEYEPRTGQYGADCFHCHGGALFTDHQFHNNGLAQKGTDRGRGDITHLLRDRNTFSTPSLRNIALTAPYMHDGRFDTLEEVIAHYNGPMLRSQTLDPNLAKHPTSGLGLSSEDQAALVAFLRTLTVLD